MQAHEGQVRCTGELELASADLFEQILAAILLRPVSRLVLQLEALDIDDGVGIATAVTVIKLWLNAGARVIVKGAPQMLAHNLYKNNLLAGQHPLELQEIRFDEPYS